MTRRIALTQLNASTLDILNVIRQNASAEYQQYVPKVEKELDIPKVGEVLYGYPALANQFINALVNRIALVRVNSATFNNAYAELKKGYLEFGETVEEVFVAITKARPFSAEKAEQRELKRSLPDVRSAFHIMNWRVQYPVTIQDEDLRMAFTSANGVQDLIAKIVDTVYTSAEYDEYLLFKYLMIKAIAHGKMYPVGVDISDIKNAAVAFRSYSNQLTFMSDKYNASAVPNTTPKADQYIFMDSNFNASYDVNVLAAAFNMDKADFTGKLKLIDDWSTFDNDRFSAIVAESDSIEAVTAEELALCANVKAVLVDAEWFQVYDNNNKFTEKYVASGMYWNYFYNVWKTISSSPFSNAIVFIDNTQSVALPATVKVTVSDKSVGETGTIFTLECDTADNAIVVGGDYNFVQTEEATKAGIAIQKYGGVMIPANDNTPLFLSLVIDGVTYTAQSVMSESVETNAISSATAVGAEFTLTKQ